MLACSQASRRGSPQALRQCLDAALSCGLPASTPLVAGCARDLAQRAVDAGPDAASAPPPAPPAPLLPQPPSAEVPIADVALQLQLLQQQRMLAEDEAQAQAVVEQQDRDRVAVQRRLQAALSEAQVVRRVDVSPIGSTRPLPGGFPASASSGDLIGGEVGGGGGGGVGGDGSGGNVEAAAATPPVDVEVASPGGDGRDPEERPHRGLALPAPVPVGVTPPLLLRRVPILPAHGRRDLRGRVAWRCAAQCDSSCSVAVRRFSAAHVVMPHGAVRGASLQCCD